MARPLQSSRGASAAVRRSCSAVVVATVIAVACSSPETADLSPDRQPLPAAGPLPSMTTAPLTTREPSTPEATPPTPGTVPTPFTAPTATSAPPTLDDQIGWVIAALNDGSVTENDVEHRFSAEFLSSISAATVVATIARLHGASARWVEVARDGDGVGAEVGLAAGTDRWLLLIAIADDGSIEYLAIQPDMTEDVDPPSSLDEVAQALGGAGDVAMLVADVSDGTCETVYDRNASSTRPVGSDFKLYVLGALVDAIAAGELRWDDPVVIRDGLKSLPSGTFQDLDDGTTLTVQEFAQAMIAASDNTATDHLIDLVGRSRVEAAQAVYGHEEPSLNVPMLTTREFFALKLALTDDERDAFITADGATRRALLDGDIADREVTLDDAIDWNAPRAIRQIEYFASSVDLCRAMVALHTRPHGASAETVRTILSANPGGVELDNEWTYVGFKGGGEPGVLSLVWYLESDSRTYVFAVNVTNDHEALPESQLVGVAHTAIELLAGQ